MDQNFPDLAAFKAYMVNRADVMEVVKWSLYDTMLYPTAGALNIDFFQQQIGQGSTTSTGVAAGSPKSLADTNMDAGGFLPAPQGFWIETIELIVTPGSVSTANTFTIQQPAGFAAAAAAAVQGGAHDVNAILTTGSMRFTVGDKPYLIEAPLYRLPPWCRMKYNFALATTSGTVGETTKDYMNAGGDVYSIVPGIAIPTMQNFKLSLQWPVVVATPSGFNGKIQAILDGWLFRAVQ